MGIIDGGGNLHLGPIPINKSCLLVHSRPLGLWNHVVHLEYKCQDVAGDEIRDDEQENCLPDGHVVARQDKSVVEEECLSCEEHCMVPCVHWVHSDGSIGLQRVRDDEVIESIFDSQESIQHWNIEVLNLVSSIPSLMWFDSSDVWIIGVNIGIDGIKSFLSSRHIGEWMMSEEMLMQPGVERCSVHKIMNRTQHSPNSWGFRR